MKPQEPQAWELYLTANEEMNTAHPLVRQAAKEAVGGAVDESEKAKRIFYFVRDSLPYNMYPKNTNHPNYYASAVLENGEGWCLQKSMLAATLSRVAGIPARVRFAELINHSLNEKAKTAIGTNHFSPHTYAEVFLHQQWVPITPVFDAKLCRQLEVPTVEFDGVHPALLAAETLAGAPYMEYISKTPGYARLPWEHILGEIHRVYQEKSTIWFADDFEEQIKNRNF